MTGHEPLSRHPTRSLDQNWTKIVARKLRSRKVERPVQVPPSKIVGRSILLATPSASEAGSNPGSATAFPHTSQMYATACDLAHDPLASEAGSNRGSATSGQELPLLVWDIDLDQQGGAGLPVDPVYGTVKPEPAPSEAVH